MVRIFHVRNMVCNRCIKVLRSELSNKNIELLEIELGKLKINIKEAKDSEIIESVLRSNGFELIDSPEKQLVEQVKIELLKLLRKLPLHMQRNLSKHLQEKLNLEYSKISKIFSLKEKITIEKYFIKLKIEKVKELIQTRAYNFTEIAQLLDYSHINHLSRQFKREMKMSLSDYKKQQKNSRIPLDKII
ncbi:helix-turn-helix domain-containing protein [Pareuzebyella sediminis]|uniref:helix-turn-helix domain-containing protein n=1 Tax=Pareuzebyella sediminis TaxID=2607998 RepID=UPI0011EF6CFE|nr:AraC family transcriptional regulator [Pareuzebyella sediminis]